MKNVEMKVEDDKLIIVIDLKKRMGDSATGKTTVIASSLGNQDIPGLPGAKVGINAYISKKIG